MSNKIFVYFPFFFLKEIALYKNNKAFLALYSFLKIEN